MEKLVGRIQEKIILQNALASPGAELIAVYGRRRVGKTFLIRSVYEKYLRFEFTGVNNAGMQQQLESFSFALKKAIKSPVDIAISKTWAAAFNLMESFLTLFICFTFCLLSFKQIQFLLSGKVRMRSMCLDDFISFILNVDVSALINKNHWQRVD